MDSKIQNPDTKSKDMSHLRQTAYQQVVPSGKNGIIMEQFDHNILLHSADMRYAIRDIRAGIFMIKYA